MPRKSMLFVIVLTLLLGVGVVATHGLTQGFNAQAADLAPANPVNDAGPEQDAPVKIRSGHDEPRAHQPETPRRLEAPERQLADFGSRMAPVPDTLALRSVDAAAAAVGGSDPATPLHLRHCVFLC